MERVKYDKYVTTLQAASYRDRINEAEAEATQLQARSAVIIVAKVSYRCSVRNRKEWVTGTFPKSLLSTGKFWWMIFILSQKQQCTTGQECFLGVAQLKLCTSLLTKKDLGLNHVQSPYSELHASPCDNLGL